MSYSEQHLQETRSHAEELERTMKARNKFKARDFNSAFQHLHKHLSENNIQHHYAEFPGGHEWDYWRKHIEDSLLFFNGF